MLKLFIFLPNNNFSLMQLGPLWEAKSKEILKNKYNDDYLAKSS